MSIANNTRPGHFIWYELSTTHPEAAPAFYECVIGWSSRPMEGSEAYTLFVTEQGPVAGAAKLSARAQQMGVPPHWMSSVQVTDVDASVARVKNLGGKIYAEPVEQPDIGRFAIIADPFGAVIGVCSPVQPMQVRDASKPGEVCWRELL